MLVHVLTSERLSGRRRVALWRNGARPRGRHANRNLGPRDTG
ncbi:hypothetical protein GLA29479_1366 [Lysobacter antibioticus]|nr:hypothetical protein GLA29479_1366 [Lysobacter antibioticus]